jgi:O-antigen/teichoic acid export membrane protein
MGLVLIVVLYWPRFLALFGAGNEPARFDLTLKSGPPSATYVVIVLAAALLFELLPYVEEFFRGLRANGGALVPKRSSRGRDVAP